MMRHLVVICVSVILIVSLTIGLRSQTIGRRQPVVNEVPGEYQENPGLLLTHFQEGRIPLTAVVQILILWRGEGRFVTLEEAYPDDDMFFIHAKHHDMIRRSRTQLYQRMERYKR